MRQLEYLLALEEHRHFRRAAEVCGVSQPTLSAQLRGLEERLGVQLVERNRSAVIVTPVGRQVAAIGRRMLSDAEEIRQLAAAQGEDMGGTIRLGLPPTIGPYLLPRMISDLHATYPKLKLYVREDIPTALPPALEQGRHDVLVMPLSVNRKDLDVEPLFREPLYLAMAADHPLAARSKLGRRDLRGYAVLTLESGHQLHEQVKRLCDEVGAKLMSDYEGTSLDTLREMVGMGMGVSFLPGLYVHSSLAQDATIKVSSISGAPIYRTVGLVWRKSSARKQEFLVLANHLRDAVRREFPQFTIIG
ncbi:MAG: LysR family transcriptional regulator [Rhodospirillales bacterium]|nr:MAG: LysR family transcriptional regulator [Rhodospirillales bacterium]